MVLNLVTLPFSHACRCTKMVNLISASSKSFNVLLKASWAKIRPVALPKSYPYATNIRILHPPAAQRIPPHSRGLCLSPLANSDLLSMREHVSLPPGSLGFVGASVLRVEKEVEKESGGI